MSQLVRRGSRKLALTLKHRIQPGDHAVEGAREPAHLIIRQVEVQPAAQVLPGDLLCHSCHLVDRPQRA